MTPQAVIFDIGNVLIKWRPERFYDRVLGQDRRRALFAAVDLPGMNERVDRGENFRTVVYETAETCPEFRREIRMWYDNWIEMAQPSIPHSVALMQALQRNGVPVFALSNFGVDSFAVALVYYPFLRAFDRAYISGLMGAIKPDPRIYSVVEADCGVAPGGLLFTDDRDDNIAAAAARGWQTHRFRGPSGLAARLVAEGLLSAEEAAA